MVDASFVDNFVGVLFDNLADISVVDLADLIRMNIFCSVLLEDTYYDEVDTYYSVLCFIV